MWRRLDQLQETFPETDPYTVRFTDLHNGWCSCRTSWRPTEVERGDSGGDPDGVARGVCGREGGVEARGSIEEVGVSSCALETDQILLDAIDEEPVGLDVCVSIARPFISQWMVSVPRRQG